MIKNLNAYTSLFFLSNIYYLLDASDIIYLSSFIILLITSVIFHSTKLKYIGYIDKIATYNIIFQGGYSFIRKSLKKYINKYKCNIMFFISGIFVCLWVYV